MDLQFAVVAEQLEQLANGKVTIHGIFDAIYSPAFPCLLPEAVLICGFQMRVADRGTTRHVAAELRDPDGQAIRQWTASLTIPEEQPHLVWCFIGGFPLEQVSCPIPGDYEFVITDGPERVGRVLLHLVGHAAIDWG